MLVRRQKILLTTLVFYLICHSIAAGKFEKYDISCSWHVDNQFWILNLLILSTFFFIFHFNEIDFFVFEIDINTLGGIASICSRFHFQQTLRMHTQRCQGCQKTINFMRNSKILIARSTIQPKLSKIKNKLPLFKEIWCIS